MSGHSTYSASKAPRIIRCPGSIALSDGIADSSSEYADEGTAAHTLASWCLTQGKAARDFLGVMVDVFEDDLKTVRRTFQVDDDMADNVQVYVDAINREPGEKLIEQRVDYSTVVGVAEQGGTSDAIVLNFDEGVLGVHDLKFGRGVKVWASYTDDNGTVVPNEQLAGYACGAILEYELLGDWEKIKIAIHQPRINHYDEYIMTRDELRAFAQSFRAAVSEAEACFDEKRRPLSVEQLQALGVLNPGEKQCRFCPAADRCPALAGQARSNAFDDYDAMQAKQVDAVAIDDLPSYDELELIEVYLKAMRTRIQRELQAGKKVKGWKLVLGKKGSRKFVDDKIDAVLKLLRKFKLKKADIYGEPPMKSPTQLEKQLTKEQYAELAAYVTQSDPGYNVAPDSDPTPALEVNDVTALLGDDSDLI